VLTKVEQWVQQVQEGRSSKGSLKISSSSSSNLSRSTGRELLWAMPLQEPERNSRKQKEEKSKKEEESKKKDEERKKDQEKQQESKKKEAESKKQNEDKKKENSKKEESKKKEDGRKRDVSAAASSEATTEASSSSSWTLIVAVVVPVVAVLATASAWLFVAHQKRATKEAIFDVETAQRCPFETVPAPTAAGQPTVM